MGRVKAGGTTGGVRIRLLGGVGAVDDRGEALDVGPAKCQAVLAALALEAGSAVPVWRLVEQVWGEDPPRTASRTLQSYVARLRRGLGGDAIVRIGGAYRLDVAADAVDIVRFQRMIDAGEVDAALAEWAGYPLAGLAVPGLNATVDGLVERWLSAVEADLRSRVETDAAGVVGPLTELTASHPFREGLWALLMTALYRAGRQADALAAYRTARRTLVEQLGVEPGPLLRELESSILGHDERLTGPRPARGRPTGTVTFGFCEVEEADRQAMVRYAELVGHATGRHGGHVFATGGDSFGVAFHRAADAVSWAGDLLAAAGGERVRLRIGLHTGETEEREQGYFGPAVNVAACLAATGHGGQILASGATAALLDQCDLRELGTYRLDGVVTEQRVFQVGDEDHPPLRAGDGRRGNLPLRLGRLIGRDRELEIIDGALAAYPVVTLVGPGGIGKTRLALAAARRAGAGDGAWLVDLAEIASPGDVPQAVAGALGIKESSGRIRTESIVAALRSRRVLLVLDNCEHVIHGAASLAQALAEGCPDLRVLATSREGLGLGGGLERLIAVAPLDPAGAGVELFNERASAVSGVFDPDADRKDVEEICRRLEGVPLAIELAATRTVGLATGELLERLDNHLRLLVGGRRTGAERHRTLRATIQWSYDLLSPARQRLFQRLSIFAGPFGLAAAEAVAADAVPAGPAAGAGVASGSVVDDGAAAAAGRSVAAAASAGQWGARQAAEARSAVSDAAASRVVAGDAVQAPLVVGGVEAAQGGVGGVVGDVDLLLGDLVERSMLVVESGPFGRRFRLLETMRQFAAERLVESGHHDLVADRHTRWCLDRAGRIRLLLSGQGEVEGAARLAELWPNLRVAFRRACARKEPRLAFALVRPVADEVARRCRNEIGDWAEQILAMTPPEDEDLLVFGLSWAAQRYKLARDPAAYEHLAGRYGEPDHPLVHHARASLYDDHHGLVKWGPSAAGELRRCGADDLADRVELDAAAAVVFQGELEEGDVVVGALADRFRAHGPPTLLNWALMLLGYSASFQGRQERAERVFEEAVSVDLPERTFSPNKSVEARVIFRRGDRSRAFGILRAHIEELLDTDNLYATCVASVEFINMMAMTGRLAESARILGYFNTTTLLDSPVWQSQVAEARGRIVAGLRRAPEEESDLDGRQALEYMRAVLHDMT